jgi:hypothetical protein
MNSYRVWLLLISSLVLAWFSFSRGALTVPAPLRVLACGGKYFCPQMANCAEARRYYNQCALTRLDRDAIDRFRGGKRMYCGRRVNRSSLPIAVDFKMHRPAGRPLRNSAGRPERLVRALAEPTGRDVRRRVLLG